MDHTILKKAVEQNPFTSINETVYQHLRNAIIMLDFKPGEKLRETQIAEELKISRSPVKAALQRLEQENLVERAEGKSYSVSRIQYEDCRALVEARKGIEGIAAFYAANRMTAKELEQLKNLLLKFKLDQDIPTPEEFAKTDAMFHHLIVKAARNKYLEEAYGLIQSNLLRYRLYIMRQLDITELHEYESHLPVYYALKRRCSTLARDEMLVSIDHMYEAIRFL